MPIDLSELNNKQIEVVTSNTDNHLLILAGAGSGKTKVLTHRIAWLIENHIASPYEVLAITFTNKAANEIKKRIELLLGDGYNSKLSSVGTFHNIANKLLRIYHEKSGIAKNFQIIEPNDQLRIIKRIMYFTLNDSYDKKNQSAFKSITAKSILNEITNAKLANYMGQDSFYINNYDSKYQSFVKKIIQLYKNELAECQLLDFDDLIIKLLELISNNEDILHKIQTRYPFVLVDEFQDTDKIQYKLLKKLKGDDNKVKVMAVGDDDQCIYGWRGAEFINLKNFSTEFLPCNIIKLEQNYRSTPEILDAANKLIKSNNNRFNKVLWTENTSGEPVKLYIANTVSDESNYIAQAISRITKSQNNYNNIAILYRKNSQSRSIEESLLVFNIPYIVHGGTKFFSRIEIKDSLAYLRLVVNTNDNIAFERCIHTPSKGIGAKRLNLIIEKANFESVSFFEASELLVKENNKLFKNLEIFLDKIKKMIEYSKEYNLPEKLTYIITESGIWEHYEKYSQQMKINSAETNIATDNLSELIKSAQQFYSHYKYNFNDNLELCLEFLSQISLQNEVNDNNDNNITERVNLMTIHSSKGLEFDHVFIIGLENGSFPIESCNLEEERRLFYVALTRAKKTIHISYSSLSNNHYNHDIREPSIFLNEVPYILINNTTIKNSNNKIEYGDKDYHKPTNKKDDLTKGIKIKHPIFGIGTILSISGDNENAKLKVLFDVNIGEKVLIKKFANITLLPT